MTYSVPILVSWVIHYKFLGLPRIQSLSVKHFAHAIVNEVIVDTNKKWHILQKPLRRTKLVLLASNCLSESVECNNSASAIVDRPSRLGQVGAPANKPKL
jgi:hypothetical protein